MNTKIICCIINVWGNRGIEFKVKRIKKEPMKSTKFPYHALVIKYISKALDMMG